MGERRRCRGGGLEGHLAKQEAGDLADDPHDRSPDAGDVDDVSASVDGFGDAHGGLVRFEDKGLVFEVSGHGSTDGAGFNGEDVDIVRGESIAEGFEVGVKSGLGSGVYGVSASSTITCDRADTDDGSAFGLGKAFGGFVEPSDGSKEIDLDDRLIFGEVEFIGCEGGHDTSGVDDEFKAGGLLGDLLEESGDLGVVGGVVWERKSDGIGVALVDLGSEFAQQLDATGDESDGVAFFGEVTGQGFSDP